MLSAPLATVHADRGKAPDDDKPLWERMYPAMERPTPRPTAADRPLWERMYPEAPLADAPQTRTETPRNEEKDGGAGLTLLNAGAGKAAQPAQTPPAAKLPEAVAHAAAVTADTAGRGLSWGERLLSALGPDAAQAALLPGFRKAFFEAIKKGDTRNMPAGSFEPEVFEKLGKLYPQAKNDVKVSIHPYLQRSKQGWTKEDVADAISELLDSKAADIVRNYNTRGPNSAYGVFLPGKEKALFGPVAIGDDTVLKTIFQPRESQMKRLGRGGAGGETPLAPQSQARQAGQGGTPPDAQQMPPLSVAPPRSGHADGPGGMGKPDGQGKAAPQRDPTAQPDADPQTAPDRPLLPAAAAGGSLAHATETPRREPQEKGLESPWFDPVDIILAPFGMPTAGGKLGAATLEGAFGLFMDWLTNRNAAAPHPTRQGRDQLP